MRGFLVLACACALVACDSTGPRALTPAQLARHFDSLLVASNDRTNGGEQRYSVIEDVEIPPALGAAPVPVAITTKSGLHDWQGFMWRMTTTGPNAADDSLYVIIAYSDYNLTNVLQVMVEYAKFTGTFTTPPPPAVALELLVGDTVTIFAGYGTIPSGSQPVTASLESHDGACTVATGLSKMGLAPFLPSFDNISCALATFAGGGSFTFPGATGPYANFQTVGMVPQRFNGVDLATSY